MQSARWACSLVACCLTAAACARGTATGGGPDDGALGVADSGLQPADASNPIDVDGAPANVDATAPLDAALDSAAIASDAGDGAAASDGALPTTCAAPRAFDEGASYERELFVATSGDDANDGSSTRPLRSIRAASDRATAGTRVVVRAGSYQNVSLNGVKGEALRPIAFVAEGEVFIEGATGVGWAMSSPSYVVIQGFTIQNAPITGLSIDDGGNIGTPAHHVVLRNLTVRNTGTGGNNDCIRLSGVDDFWLLGSKVSNCNRGEALDLVGCHRGVVSKNQFRDTQQGGVKAAGGSSDTLIHANLFENVPGRAVSAGGSTPAEQFRPSDAAHEALRIRVVANLFLRTGTDNSSGTTIAYVGCDGCVFAHNTVVEPRRVIARILQENTAARLVPARNGLFVDNLLLIDTWQLSGSVSVGAGTLPESFVFGSNLWFAVDQTSYTGPVLDGGIPQETGSLVQVSPQLVDRVNGNYRPLSTSPANGAARPLDFALPPDFDGRCYTSPATLGAFAAP